MLKHLFAGTAMAMLVALATPSAFAEEGETPEMFPDHAGRDEAMAICSACHGFKLVAAQGLTVAQWEDTLNWMSEKHNMPVLEGDDRKVIVDYLATAFPPKDTAQRGWKNPFAGQ